jgi:hypothetical protein
MNEDNSKKKREVENSNNKDNQSSPVPKEIDTHYQLYGKHSWEVKYYEKCEICNSPFDEFGFCACGSING